MSVGESQATLPVADSSEVSTSEICEAPTSLDELVAWLNTNWSERKTNGHVSIKIVTAVDSYIAKSENPYIAFMDLLDSLPSDSDSSPDTVQTFVWNRFVAWHQNRLPRSQPLHKGGRVWFEQFRQFITSDVLYRGAVIALKNNVRRLSLASGLFRFSDFPHDGVTEAFSRKVMDFVVEKNYHGIAVIFEHQIEILSPSNLLDDETLHRISVLLICKKRLRTAKQMLAKVSPTERMYMLVSCIDSLVATTMPERVNRIKADLGLPRGAHIPMDYFEQGSIELIKDLNVPPDYCRHLTSAGLRKKTGFMIRCTFGPDAEMDLSTFRELIWDFAKVDSSYPEYIVKLLIKCSILDEARCLAEIYELDEIRYSPIFSSFSPRKPVASSSTNPVDATKQSAKAELESLPLYQIPLPEEAIFFINSPDEYRAAFTYILSLASEPDSPRRWIGIDAEWPSVLPPGRKQIASILQFGLIDRVFIFDLENLSPFLSDVDWQLMEEMFKCPDIKKITFGFTSDITMLNRSYPNGFKDGGLVSTVDIEQLGKAVWAALMAAECGPCAVNDNTATLHATPSSMTPRSLVDVAHRFLGRRISKMFRMSNWSRRPLDRGQLLYAAVDSYCLLEIYREICFVVSSQNLHAAANVARLLRGDAPDAVFATEEALNSSTAQSSADGSLPVNDSFESLPAELSEPIESQDNIKS